MVAAALSITVVYVPQYFRVVRSTTASAKGATYVGAARAIGAPHRTVMGKYLFGNVIQSVPVIGALNASGGIPLPPRSRCSWLVAQGLNETANPTLRKRRLRKVVLPPMETSTYLAERDDARFGEGAPGARGSHGPSAGGPHVTELHDRPRRFRTPEGPQAATQVAI